MKVYRVLYVGWLNIQSTLTSESSEGWELHTIILHQDVPLEYMMIFEMDRELFNKKRKKK